jgi:uncharacterized protein (TIGR00290 family)
LLTTPEKFSEKGLANWSISFLLALMKKRVLLSWSSGKDSAWALHLLRQQSDLEIVGLLTTFNHAADRVAMHAVRRKLVEAQAELAGLPLWPVELNWPCSNADYESLMSAACQHAVAERVTHVAFGDVFLRDIREYRERQLAETGLKPLFPVWHLPTDQLASEMIRSGLRAKVTCIDPNKLARMFVGRDFDASFLHDLPADIDPCGENGEFHTFVFDAPIFRRPIDVDIGDIVERDGFVFADVVPRAIRASAIDPGLCSTCTHARVITNDRGSEFWRCGLSDNDNRFPKYPRLPVIRCQGYQPST